MPVPSDGKQFAEPAGCLPEKACVPIQLDPEEVDDGDLAAISVYPACTRLDRCGGCCSHPLLSCQPTSTETIVRDVLVIDTVNFTDR